MQRGVITFTKHEVVEIINRVDLKRYNKSPIENKLRAAFGKSASVEVPVEVSEDELEFILDELVIPDPVKDNEHTKSLRKKINYMLKEFRQGGKEGII